MNEANIGIDLGGTKLLIICKKEQCRVESGPDFSPQMMETAILDFLNERDINPTGIGIAIPGFVDRSGNVGYCDVLPKLTGWSPYEAFADFGCKVVAINDVNAALVEEMHDAENGITA